jgi:hypothetical protein
VVKWLALLLRIREVSGSNVGPETGYLAGIVPKIMPRSLSSTYFSIHYSLAFHSTLRSLATESVFK